MLNITNVHKDLLAFNEEEVRDEFRARQEVAIEREQKRQKIEIN